MEDYDEPISETKKSNILAEKKLWSIRSNEYDNRETIFETV